MNFRSSVIELYGVVRVALRRKSGAWSGVREYGTGAGRMSVSNGGVRSSDWTGHLIRSHVLVEISSFARPKTQP